MEELIVNNNENSRLDAYIASNTNLSRVAVQRLIETNDILVNMVQQKSSYKVKLNDKITINTPEPKQISLVAQDIPIDVIYEDDYIIVVNKPKGLVVHPANGNPDGTLVNAIMSICKDSLSGIGGEVRPGIVHRLDKDTSGVLIVAKNDEAHIKMSEQIKNREVKKIYIALVRGQVPEEQATINMPIGRSIKDRKKMAVCKNGKEAVTHFTVLQRFNKYTLLQIKIDTGRTHQIRVHLSEIGFPVIGDSVYSNGKNEFNVKGQMLHAQKLEFKHPITSKLLSLEAPLPKYFNDVLEKLQNN